MSQPSRAGFVLVGGRSSRMGRDKALLAFDGATLVESIATKVERACGDVALIGPPERYGALGLRVIPDRIPGAGPMGGLYTALDQSPAEWNLIVACDMPDLSPDLFEDLFCAAADSAFDCVVAGFERRIHPLCAVYHRRAAAPALRAINRKQLKMQDFVSSLHSSIWPVADAALLSNINTPIEWSTR